MSALTERYSSFFHTVLFLAFLFAVLPAPHLMAGEEDFSIISKQPTREHVMSLPGKNDTTHIFNQSPMPPLTAEEERVLIHKGTERPFSGRYWKETAPGTYVCRNCGAPLYASGDKFDSGCGWPSFDDEIPGAVRRTPDADGQRTEITCAACGAHLGHVFEGEHFTPKNTRHCVNSLSLTLIPEGQPLPGAEISGEGSIHREQADGIPPSASLCSGVAYFAGGCFWGVEDAFSKTEGVCDAVSGYAGGNSASPSYEQVSSGRTGHAETVRVSFDPARTSFEKLARVFFEVHDPTQMNRQGPDVGTQYRSAIFYTDEAQKRTAETLIARLRELGYDVATQLVPFTNFYPAEDYHQDFAARTGRGACHIRVPRFERRR